MTRTPTSLSQMKLAYRVGVTLPASVFPLNVRTTYAMVHEISSDHIPTLVGHLQTRSRLTPWCAERTKYARANCRILLGIWRTCLPPAHIAQPRGGIWDVCFKSHRRRAGAEYLAATCRHNITEHCSYTTIVLDVPL